MADSEPEPLAPYLIQNAPSSMFYISNFIGAEEEEYILNKVRLILPVHGSRLYLTNDQPDPAEQMDLALPPTSPIASSPPYSVQRSDSTYWSSRLVAQTCG